MTSNLYEELGVPSTATTEEIKKAYKKKALKTHPDRLPQNATPEEKKDSEEHFRRVNNAYEILTDSEKRKEYDLHGVWPPPEDIPGPSTTNNFTRNPFDSHFNNAFFSRHRHANFHSFTFTDPFTLFESIFGDSAPRRTQRFGFNQGPFFESPFDSFARLEREFDDEFFGFGNAPFGGLGGLNHGLVGAFPPFPAFPQISDMPRTGGGGGRWASESHITQTINGVTQTIHKRRDYEGNEHVTQTFPDGRTVHTINGVEQSQPHGYLPGNADPRQLPRLQGPGPEPHRRSSLPPSPTNPGPPPPYPVQTAGQPQHSPTDQYSPMVPPVNPRPPTGPDMRRHRDRERGSHLGHNGSIHRQYHSHGHFKYHNTAPSPPPPQARPDGSPYDDKHGYHKHHWFNWRG